MKGFEETGPPGRRGLLPRFNWSGYTNMQRSAFDERPKTQDLKVFEWTNNVTHIRGRHILRGNEDPALAPHSPTASSTSASGLRTASRPRTPPAPPGRVTAFADFMLGYPRQAQRAFPADTFGGQSTYWHFYAAGRLPGHGPAHPHTRVWATNIRPGPRAIAASWAPSTPPPRGRSSWPARPTRSTSTRSSRALRPMPSSSNAIQTSSQAGLPLSITSTDRPSSGRASASPGGPSATARWCAAATPSSSSRRTPTAA